MRQNVRLAEWKCVLGLIADFVMLIVGISAPTPAGFKALWVLICLGGVVYFGYGLTSGRGAPVFGQFVEVSGHEERESDGTVRAPGRNLEEEIRINEQRFRRGLISQDVYERESERLGALTFGRKPVRRFKRGGRKTY